MESVCLRNISRCLCDEVADLREPNDTFLELLDTHLIWSFFSLVLLKTGLVCLHATEFHGLPADKIDVHKHKDKNNVGKSRSLASIHGDGVEVQAKSDTCYTNWPLSTGLQGSMWLLSPSPMYEDISN